ncbi:hypothetical protein BCA37_11815 [Mycobacterium sp. djl-10]|nr:hypothetical protein BCA37_11815 [Mycobacterium sp. djl-10]
MSMLVQPRVAVVTGASGCVGGAIARRLAADGAAVVVGYRANRNGADLVVDDIVAAGGTATSYRTDVTDPAEVHGMFEAAQQRYGSVDIVVNAARRDLPSTLAAVVLQDFDGAHQTNVRGTFLVNQQAAQRLRVGGVIVNLVRGGSARPSAGSDEAVEALTIALAGELTSRGITVNAVACVPTGARVDGSASTDSQIPDAVAQLIGSPPTVTGQIIAASHPIAPMPR